jgi:SAM-dependent methyltransferase
MSEQADAWSRAADGYEEEFIDPDRPGVRNPLRDALAALADPTNKTAADLGCGIGPLLPFLAKHFRQVWAVDFAEGMLARARESCKGWPNVHFLQRNLSDLHELEGKVDVAVAVNSLVMPNVGELETTLHSIHAALKPQGRFLGIVPAIDAVHYLTMIWVDRARQLGMPEDKARQNAAHHAEHALYDFAFGQFRFKGLDQHFWQPFEVRYRLKRAGFRAVRMAKVLLGWEQFSNAKDVSDLPPPWDWYFHAER